VELEGELDRFGQSVRDYRSTVEDLLRRRARERRRGVLAQYAASIAHERRSEGRSRAEAISHLEAFVLRHPAESRHTPSALLRLAELYVERAYELAGDGDLDLQQAIDAGIQNVSRFPGSPHRERAAYLLGWALARSGRSREAVGVWRSVVCGNLFRYPAETDDDERHRATERPPEQAHPALQAPDSPAPDREPYSGCRPHLTSLAAEIWLRIGEEHFDSAELDAAVGAYRHVTEHPEDRLYTFGLYKLAWSQYRAGRYPEAIERFSDVVRADDQLRRSGRTRTSLREEALQYIALTLAYDDWNEDGRADHTRGGPHPLERLEDGNLWPQDLAWSPEIYRRVGDALFEQALPDEAILAWRLRLSSYPAACDTPDTYLSIVRAQRQLGDEDGALATLTELAALVSADASWRTEACPGRGARAEDLAQNALASAARIRHRRAQRLRQRATLDNDAAAEQAAMSAYAVVVETYRRYLASYPNDRESYEISFDLADALYWSGRYPEAALAYATVRDSPLDGRRFAAAARRVVESERERADDDEARGAFRRRSATATAPEAVPAPLRRLARAREIYVRWVRPNEDEEHVRDAYAFNNALLVSRYGFAEEARRRWSALFVARCRGPRASAVGQAAFRALLDDAIGRGDDAEIQRLGREVRRRRCSFSATGGALLEGPCVDSSSSGEGSHPLCRELPTIETSAELSRLQREATALSARTSEGARVRGALRIATALITAVDRARTHPDAAAALLLAAHLLDEEARRPASAVRIYQRIVDEVRPNAPDVENVVAEAHFQLARAAERAFDFDRALAGYATIVESDRFRRSADPRMSQRRRDAMVNQALLTARLGRHAEAARAWSQAAAVLPEAEAREARYRSAEATYLSGDAASAARALDTWLRSGSPTVAAHALRARAAAERGEEGVRARALTAALSLYRQDPRRADAERAARAALSLADLARDALPAEPIRPGPRATLTALMAELGRQIRARSERVNRVAEAYAAVVEIGNGRQSVAALHGQGLLYEGLIRTVLAAQLDLPRDIRRRLRRSPRDAATAVREQVQDAIRENLDEQVRPVECLAIERYALAYRLARRASLPTSEATGSRERLQAYGEERVSACLAAAHAHDPSFAPLAAGELNSARAGLHLTPPTPVAPQTLAP